MSGRYDWRELMDLMKDPALLTPEQEREAAALSEKYQGVLPVAPDTGLSAVAEERFRIEARIEAAELDTASGSREAVEGDF